jgi:hypothetical protein
VVRVLGYRSGGPGSIPSTTRKIKVVGLERGPLSLVSTTEELLWRKSSGSGLENREYVRRDPSHWPRGTLYAQQLAITSPISGGRSVGIVRSRTQTMEFSYIYIYIYIYICVCVCVCVSEWERELYRWPQGTESEGDSQSTHCWASTVMSTRRQDTKQLSQTVITLKWRWPDVGQLGGRTWRNNCLIIRHFVLTEPSHLSGCYEICFLFLPASTMYCCRPSLVELHEEALSLQWEAILSL